MGDEPDSPLAGVADDAQRGEYPLHRYVPSSTDDEIRSFLAAYTPDMQAALTGEDFYTLLNFARRTALAVMRACGARSRWRRSARGSARRCGSRHSSTPPRRKRPFQALGVAAGRVCCVTIARSWVKGVAAYEQPGSLERFREPFTRALESASAN